MYYSKHYIPHSDVVSGNAPPYVVTEVILMGVFC